MLNAIVYLKFSIFGHSIEAGHTKLMEKRIKKTTITYKKQKTTVLTGEFWTSGQRQGNNLHEIAYRACFKPALPQYFISRYSKHSDVVYDPFSGRGTTIIEAALSGRNVIANDVNPISAILAEGRLFIPEIAQLEERLNYIFNLPTVAAEKNHKLTMFFHKETYKQLLILRNWLFTRTQSGELDALDKWIRMIATNRLTGHSPGFFSVYTLPPNQAVSRERQILINKKRNQKPEYRNVPQLILKKSKSLLKDLNPETTKQVLSASKKALFLKGDAAETLAIKKNSVQLTITSPPFLDVVQYAKDNWMRCWFNHVNMEVIAKKITMSKTIEEWVIKMQAVFNELYRITKKGGFVVFETGEVHHGKTRLEPHVLQMGLSAGFTCEHIIINEQQFTKTANIWGIKNNVNGTNSNRIVVFKK